jgi:ribonuclease III
VTALHPLQSRLAYKFRDPSLLRLALTHPSITQEPAPKREHNQRLEFLGDAVLQLVLTLALYERLPDLDEGSLTKARAQMVNRASLAAHARSLALGEHLLLSRGEELHGGRNRASSLADAFEALLGAVFVDGGFDAARELVLREFEQDFADLPQAPAIANPKGELQEWLQASSAEPPQYKMVSASGPDHDRDFECIVLHQGVELARGTGKSKKIAESNAAVEALRLLKEQRGAAKPPQRKRKKRKTVKPPSPHETPV